jgi:ribulose bisphosphate carboxylase small subunit
MNTGETTMNKNFTKRTTKHFNDFTKTETIETVWYLKGHKGYKVQKYNDQDHYNIWFNHRITTMETKTLEEALQICFDKKPVMKYCGYERAAYNFINKQIAAR